MSRCAGCQAVFYCNRDCQKAHWKQHKDTCKQLSTLAHEKKGFIKVVSKEGDKSKMPKLGQEVLVHYTGMVSLTCISCICVMVLPCTELVWHLVWCWSSRIWPHSSPVASNSIPLVREPIPAHSHLSWVLAKLSKVGKRVFVPWLKESEQLCTFQLITLMVTTALCQLFHQRALWSSMWSCWDSTMPKSFVLEATSSRRNNWANVQCIWMCQGSQCDEERRVNDGWLTRWKKKRFIKIKKTGK